MSADAWNSVEPVVEFCPGWDFVVEGTSTGAPSASPALSPEYLRFLRVIEEFVGVPVVYVSTGPERAEGVWQGPQDVPFGAAIGALDRGAGAQEPSNSY